MFSVPSTPLEFSSAAAVSTYLKHHPSTRNLNVRGSKIISENIIEIVANYFVTKSVYPEDINKHLVDALYWSNRKLWRIPEEEMSNMQESLKQALIDYAKGKKIELEKKKREGSDPLSFVADPYTRV